MPQTLKLAQLNIEGSKHLDLVIPFLQKQNPDVACLQELNEQDVASFEKALLMHSFFVPMGMNSKAITGAKVWGIGIFSKSPIKPSAPLQYGGYAGNGLIEYVHGDPTKKNAHDSTKFMLAVADIEKGGETFRIATTHFPVTAHGAATDFQREDMKALLGLLEKEGEFVLTGDFNAPRGGEIFAQLSAKYKDNIPPEIATSIDGAIHRAGQLPFMVDGIFSTPGYEVSNVVGHTGLSDHWGFTAEIKKVEI